MPTPLASGGVGLFIVENLNYTLLEKEAHEAFQALWIEISFSKQKNVICGIIYRQHNSPDCFIEYFSDTIEKLASTGKKNLYNGRFQPMSPEDREISIQPGLLTGLITQLSPSNY